MKRYLFLSTAQSSCNARYLYGASVRRSVTLSRFLEAAYWTFSPSASAIVSITPNTVAASLGLLHRERFSD